MADVLRPIEDHLQDKGIHIVVSEIMSILRSKHKYKRSRVKNLSRAERLRKWARIKANNRNAEVCMKCLLLLFV